MCFVTMTVAIMNMLRFGEGLMARLDSNNTILERNDAFELTAIDK